MIITRVQIILLYIISYYKIKFENKLPINV